MFFKLNFALALIAIIINKHESRPYVNEFDILNNKESLGNDESLLILISFDGFRWDYLENNTLPNLNKYFVDDGVKVKKGLKNAFTTVTFPNHWTLATGYYPESHGIVANVIYDSVLNQTYTDFGPLDNDTRWYDQNNQTVPIWILNQLKNNQKSGIVGGFPGANVPIMNQTVTYSQDYHNQLDWFEKVDNLIKLFTSQTKEERINFGVLYFPEPDETGHQFGPYSNETKEILMKCDQTIGYLIAQLIKFGLYDKMNIIVTADHGMDVASFNRSIDLSDYVDISKFKSYGGLTQINIFPNNPEDLDEIYNKLKKVPNYNIYKKEEVPDRLNYKNNIRIGPLVMFGNVGYEIFKTGRAKFDWNSWNGDHGGDNQVETMHPVFLARGPAFKRSYVAENVVNSVDIYELMCFVLDLKPALNNGSFDNVKNLIDDTYFKEKLTKMRLNRDENDFFDFDYSVANELKDAIVSNLNFIKNKIMDQVKADNELNESNKKEISLLKKLNLKLLSLLKQMHRKFISYINVFILIIMLLCFILVVQFKSNNWPSTIWVTYPNVFLPRDQTETSLTDHKKESNN